MENRQQIAAQIVEKGQADAHKKQDNVHHPAEKLIYQSQQRGVFSRQNVAEDQRNKNDQQS
jgi:hypothetical protein